MSGEDLYNLWAEGMEAEGVSVDPWEAISGEEQRAWGYVAAQLDYKGAQ